MTENTTPQEKATLEVPAAICLTENKPVQARDVLWARQITADLLPNYKDLRFPYKKSSILCPFCQKPLTGNPLEREKPVVEEPEGNGKKKRIPKKPKPWEIQICDLHHETKEDEKSCQLQILKKHPQGNTIILTVIGHQITWLKALKEQASLPEDQRNNDNIRQNLEKDATLPRLITSTDQTIEESPNRKDTLL